MVRALEKLFVGGRTAAVPGSAAVGATIAMQTGEREAHVSMTVNARASFGGAAVSALLSKASTA